MNVRKTQLSDLDRIMDILAYARKTIGALGIDQWQNGYPSSDVIEEDIALERSRVLAEEDGTIAATYALIKDGEPTYDIIYEGDWLTHDGPYAAIHRVAVNGAMRRGGMGSAAISAAESEALADGFYSLRIDTHRGNLPMRGMLEKNGFTYCGIIHLLSGEERVAYEKILRK